MNYHVHKATFAFEPEATDKTPNGCGCVSEPKRVFPIVNHLPHFSCFEWHPFQKVDVLLREPDIDTKC